MTFQRYSGYETLDTPPPGNSCAPGERPPLARMGEIVDELNRVASYISAFIERCGLCPPEPPSLCTGSPKGIEQGHLGDLSRLEDALHRVDFLARELQRIG